MKLLEEIEKYGNDIFVLAHKLTEMVPQHKHIQGHILVVQNGVATMNVEHNAYYIPNGYFVWIPSGVFHRISFGGKSIDLLNIYYPSDMPMGEFYNEVSMHPIPSILYHIVEQINTKTRCYHQDDWQYEMLVTLNHILPNIINKQKYQLRLPTSDHPIINRIITIIQERYQSDLTAQDTARAAGLSVRSMSRHLRNELNTSFVQYLRTYRIIMAIHKIVEEEENMSSIAYAVGYDSLTAFSNSFYKVTGIRPSHFLDNNN